MAPIIVAMSDSTRPGHLSEAVQEICGADEEPAVKAQLLRELAAWYRAFATQAANPAIWDSRLLTAEHLEIEARRLDHSQGIG